MPRQDDYNPRNPYGGRKSTETVLSQGGDAALGCVQAHMDDSGGDPSTDLAVEEEGQNDGASGLYDE